MKKNPWKFSLENAFEKMRIQGLIKEELWDRIHMILGIHWLPEHFQSYLFIK